MNRGDVATRRTRGAGNVVCRAASYVLLTCGLMALAYAGFVVVNAHAFQARALAALEASRAGNLGVRLGAVPLPVADGDVVGEMQIARLGLDVVIVQGDSPGVLRRAVGHLPATPLPGAVGNVVLAGHRDTFFRALRLVQPGDTLTLRTSQGDFHYEIESSSVVPPMDLSVLQPSTDRTLTLITCFPFYYVGPAPNRFIVRARQVAPLAVLAAGKSIRQVSDQYVP